MPFGTNFTWEQVQELLQKQQESFQQTMQETVAGLTRMNPLDQKKFDEQMLQEKRKKMMMIELGKAEEQAVRNRREGCSHMRYPAGHRHAGASAPKGALGAEWCTAGQAYQNGTAMVMCQRCQTVWLFRPTPDYYTVILQNGLLSEAPPAPEYQLCGGCMENLSKCRCTELNDIYRENKIAVPA